MGEVDIQERKILLVIRPPESAVLLWNTARMHLMVRTAEGIIPRVRPGMRIAAHPFPRITARIHGLENFQWPSSEQSKTERPAAARE